MGLTHSSSLMGSILGFPPPKSASTRITLRGKVFTGSESLGGNVGKPFQASEEADKSREMRAKRDERQQGRWPEGHRGCCWGVIIIRMEAESPSWNLGRRGPHFQEEIGLGEQITKNGRAE